MNKFSENEKITPMSLLNYHFGRLDKAGYNPRNRTKQNILMGFIMFFCMMFTFILEGIFLFTNNYTDFGAIMIDIVLLAGYWQLTIKLYILFTKQRSFLKLIDVVDYKFWGLDVLPESERAGIQNVYNFARIAARCYDIGMGITLMGHYLTAYFRGKESLVNNIWMPHDLQEWNRTPTGHHIIFLIQALIMACAIFFGLNMLDSIYIILIASVLAQLKIIKCRYLGLKPENPVKENMIHIVECIDHHNLMFDFLKNVEVIFSTALLHVAGSIIILAVMCMYGAMVETDTARIITYIFMFICVNVQLFIYCIMGQLIQDETISVADSVYMSRWQDIPDKTIRLSLMLVIQRSQKFVNITMGGFFILCLETFTRVSKMMFSLLTFMRNFDVGKS